MSLETSTDGKGCEGSLGLGWVLALSLGGGIMLFSSIGFFLAAWRMRRHPQLYMATEYTGSHRRRRRQQQQRWHMSDKESGFTTSGSRSTRLLKRGGLAPATSSLGDFFSDVSLPQLPSLASLNMNGRKLSTMFALDEEAAHGPKVNKAAPRRRRGEKEEEEEGWLSEGGPVRAPKLPEIHLQTEKEELQVSLPRRQQQQQQGEEVEAYGSARATKMMTEVPGGYQRSVPLSQTAPGLMMNDGSPTRGRSRVYVEPHQQVQRGSLSVLPIKQCQIWQNQSPTRQQQQQQQQRITRPSATENDLKLILRSTEQRLREGSQSPPKTPRHSPTKSYPFPSRPMPSPTKTPKSYRSVASSATPLSVSTSGRCTPERGTVGYAATSPTKTHSRTSSVCSAADSLIEAATQEFKIPGVLTSPTRGGGSARPKQPCSLERSKSCSSIQSHDSSSLSTLYSVGDAEEVTASVVTDDLFLDNENPQVNNNLQSRGSWQTRQLLNGTYALSVGELRPASMLSRFNSRIDVSAIPAPLRTLSMRSTVGMQGHGLQLGSESLGMVFPQHSRASSEDVRPKRQQLLRIDTGKAVGGLGTECSVSSMGTRATHRNGAICPETAFKTRNQSTNAALRKCTDDKTTSASSPLKEENTNDRLTMTSRPSGLTPFVSTGPILLTPPPSRSKDSSPILRMRGTSPGARSSSNYDQDSITSSKISIDDPATRDGRNGQGPTSLLGNAIAELRRMNSFVSSYSAASLASAALGGNVGDSTGATTTALRGGGSAPSTTNSKITGSGTINYLSLGGNGQPSKGKAPQQQQEKSTLKQPKRGHNRSKSNILVRPELAIGKENQGLDPRAIRFGVPVRGLREGRRAGNAAPLLSPPEGRFNGFADDIVVENIKQEEKREKRESAYS